MPTRDREEALTLDEARERVAEKTFSPTPQASEVGRVGLEPEFFVIEVDAAGNPRRRARLEQPGGVLDTLDEVARCEGLFWRSIGTTPVYELAHGGRLTFEPGGQVEHSTAIHESAARALTDVDCVAHTLDEWLRKRDRTLVACGLDLWHSVEEVPQQLQAPRYHSMAAYFAARGPEGAVMMRHTASQQVNLDLGPPDVARQRYRLANLASPIACASFASSPRDGARSRRALAWQGLDPTRTGFPRGFLEDDGEPPERQYGEFALDADVMLFLRADGSAARGQPGFRFRDWIQEGHADHGWPTRADLDYHLTTLFPEVRLRDFFELRSADALPSRWRAASVVFWTGLLYEPTARGAALELLGGCRSELAELWQRAARQGLTDAQIGALASEVWRAALAGARRLPTGFHRAEDLAAAESFCERFVESGRSPADELAEREAEGPAAALAWARDEASCRESA